MSIRKFAKCGVAAAAAAAVLACGGEGGESEAPRGASAPPATKMPAPPAAAGASADAARAQAEDVFATRCTTCHGVSGAGNGPGSAALNPPPRDFRDPAWQASVSDDHLAKIIQYGGAAVGRSPVMPGNPDLISKPDVVAALVRHVRSLGGS